MSTTGTTLVHVVDMRREILKENRMVAFSASREKLLTRFELKEHPFSSSATRLLQEFALSGLRLHRLL